MAITLKIIVIIKDAGGGILGSGHCHIRIAWCYRLILSPSSSPSLFAFKPFFGQSTGIPLAK